MKALASLVSGYVTKAGHHSRKRINRFKILEEFNRGLSMKEVYAVLRQKELDVSRLQREVEALRVAAPLLLADGEAEDYNQPTLQRAVNETPQPDHSGWKDRGKK